MTDVTRTYLLEQGEGLLFTSDPWQWAARVTLFQEDTGLRAAQLYASPLFAHPLPIRPEGETSWRSLPVRMLWHPLLWLPEHLARPGQFPDGKDGAVVDEDPAEWGVRVMLELANAGLYDSRTGEWVDVLARAGVDLSTTAGEERVTAWARGGVDDVLDSFSIADQLDQTSPEGWARETARAETWAMREAQWSRTANALLRFTEANPDGQPPTTLAKIVAETAAACFADIAADPGSGEDYALSFSGYAFEADHMNSAEEFRVDYVLNSVKLLLIEVEETFRPSRNRVFSLLTGPDATDE